MLIFGLLLLTIQVVTANNLRSTNPLQVLAAKSGSAPKSLVQIHCFRNGKKREECLPSPSSRRQAEWKVNVPQTDAQKRNWLECENIFNGVFEVGAIAYPPAAPVITAVKFITNHLFALAVNKKEENAFADGFKKINTAIAKLDAKIEQQFANLEAKLSIADFTNEVINNVDTLVERLSDYGRRPSNTSKNELLKACEKSSPSDLLLLIKRKLSTDDVNPLHKAMIADEFKSSITFLTWREIIYHLMTRLIVLQAFCSNIADVPELDTNNKIAIMNDKWQDVDDLMKITQEKVMNISWRIPADKIINEAIELKGDNQEKANFINRNLQDMLTRNDEFYTVVGSKSEKPYSASNGQHGDQQVKAFTTNSALNHIHREKDGLTILVARSYISKKWPYSPETAFVHAFMQKFKPAFDERFFSAYDLLTVFPDRHVHEVATYVWNAVLVAIVDGSGTGRAWTHEEYYKNVNFDNGVYKWPIVTRSRGEKTDQEFVLIIRQIYRFGDPQLPAWH